ncbi:MAG: Mn2+ and Fe2+ transporter of the family [Peptococcaceae bacterium]|jgi:Mn2+/Fe2+ NRAMP family transporter|nr:Mn2+ and Fe2+ transporter of the family [Peptococcaceae bacterium]
MANIPASSKTALAKSNWGVLLGAAFLMATSAIGPGFITQTAVFTEKYLANFAFIIMASVVLDIGAQMNVWRVIAISGMRGQDVANKVLPGLGYFVAFLVALGGLAFNIGNIGGASLGINVLLGIDPIMGAVISAMIGIFIFLNKEMGKAMDTFAKALGGVMIILTLYVAIITKPPVGEAFIRTFLPTEVAFLPIITLLGGTVGGYITFAGGHRLIDAGITGVENLKEVTKGSVTGIVIASLMRVVLFLAVLGVVAAGHKLDPANPPASAFKIAAGDIGYKVFGIVLWSAAITSVVGAAYTSVSFLRSLHKTFEDNYKWWIIAFIVASTGIFVTIGRPVKLLILAGALNGLILPITLGTMLIASKRKDIIGDYKQPTWLLLFGIFVVIFAIYAGGVSLQGMAALFK